MISDQAEIDLRGILEYIAFELQAPENASGQLDRLEACIMDLDHMPKRYRQYELEPWKSRGLRVAPVDNYLILYIPDDDTQVVTIIRVMYGGRDVDTQLDRFTKTKHQSEMVGAFFVNGEICAFLCPFLRKEVSAVANRIMGITVKIGKDTTKLQTGFLYNSKCRE